MLNITFHFLQNSVSISIHHLRIGAEFPAVPGHPAQVSSFCEAIFCELKHFCLEPGGMRLGEFRKLMEQDSRSSESYRTHYPSGLGYVRNKQLPQREGLSDAAACGPKADPRDAAFLRTYSCWGVPFRDAGNAQSHWRLQQQSLSHAFVSNPNSLVGSRNLS